MASERVSVGLRVTHDTAVVCDIDLGRMWRMILTSVRMASGLLVSATREQA
jgi:hypothetical protein